MYQTVICLVLPLPAGSSNLPGQCLRSPGSRRAADLSCSVLLRMGFTCAPHVTARAVVSYTAFAPLPAFAGGIFLLHWPGSRLHRTLSGILPCEARTFLTCSLSSLQPRPSFPHLQPFVSAAATVCPSPRCTLSQTVSARKRGIPALRQTQAQTLSAGSFHRTDFTPCRSRRR